MASVISAGTTSTTALNLSGDTTGVLQLQTNGTTAAMTIDTSQNVGIGTSSPPSDTNLTVLGNFQTGFYRNVTSGGRGYFINIGAKTSGGFADGAYIFGAVDSGDATGYLTFGTRSGGSTGERMRITSGGTLLVGTTTETTLSGVIWKTTLSGGGNNLAVVNTSTNGSTTSGFQASNYTVSGANIINFYNGSGSLAGVISVPTNGSTGTTVNYGTSSDYRMKENIAPMIGALNKVLQLNPVTYTWKSNGYAGQGFIAHELQAVVPDCVTGEKDAVDAEGKPVYQGVDTSFLVATLTAAIQELKAELDEAKAEIQALKGAR